MLREVIAEISAPIIVKYKMSYHHQVEECHGIHDFSHWEKEIREVRVCIGDKTIDLTKMLTGDMENFIITKIEEDEI